MLPVTFNVLLQFTASSESISHTPPHTPVPKNIFIYRPHDGIPSLLCMGESSVNCSPIPVWFLCRVELLVMPPKPIYSVLLSVCVCVCVVVPPFIGYMPGIFICLQENKWIGIWHNCTAVVTGPYGVNDMRRRTRQATIPLISHKPNPTCLVHEKWNTRMKPEPKWNWDDDEKWRERTFNCTTKNKIIINA